MRRIPDNLYNFLFFIGLVLQVLTIYLFRVTFISTAISLSIYFGAGLSGFLFITRKMKPETTSTLLHHFMAMLYACVIFGGTLIYLFLATNYYLAQNQVYEEQYAIIESGTLAKGRGGSCDRPYVVVNRKGVEKQIIFRCDFSEQAFSSKKIQLAVSKGFLGFYIIRDKMLEE